MRSLMLSAFLMSALSTPSHAHPCDHLVDKERTVHLSYKEKWKEALAADSAKSICAVGPKYVKSIDGFYAAIKRLPKSCFQRNLDVVDQAYKRDRAQVHQTMKSRCTVR